MTPLWLLTFENKSPLQKALPHLLNERHGGLGGLLVFVFPECAPIPFVFVRFSLFFWRILSLLHGPSWPSTHIDPGPGDAHEAKAGEIMVSQSLGSKELRKHEPNGAHETASLG